MDFTRFHGMRQTLLLLFRMLLSASACACTLLVAQPSGGPYGPLNQIYPVPEGVRLIHVAPDGDPQSDGDQLTHPTTIENAIAMATTGDAILLRGGLYRTGSLRFNQGILLQPYGSEQPVFTGTLPATDWTLQGDQHWVTTWKHLFPAAPADWWRAERHVDTTPLHRFNYDMVFADGRRLVSAGSVDEVDANSYFIDYAAGRVYIGLDPEQHAIEITAHDSAMVRTLRRVHGRDNDGKGPTIRGITFTRYARLALLVEGIEPQQPMDPSDFGKDIVGTTLEHLTISHCSRVAGYFRGDGFTMRHCRVDDCGTEGIYVINSANVLLERNVVTRTNSHAPIRGYYASAIKIFNQSHHVVVRDNLIIDNPHASGIWYDVGNRHGLIVNNWVERTNDGFFFEISEGAICARNVFVDCRPGVRLLNSADVAVVQNTFVNSAIEVNRSLRSSEAGDHFGWHASAGPSVADRDRHQVQNNLMFSDRAMSAGFIQVREQEGVESIARQPQLAQLDGNLYASVAVPTPLWTWGRSGYPAPEPSEVIGSLHDLQSAYPEFERHGRAEFLQGQTLLRSVSLKRMQPRAGASGMDAGVRLADALSNAAGLESSDPFPGAYVPVRKP